jgi:hypothetical protein
VLGCGKNPWSCLLSAKTSAVRAFVATASGRCAGHHLPVGARSYTTTRGAPSSRRFRPPAVPARMPTVVDLAQEYEPRAV